MKNILILSNSLSNGGGERIACNLANGLKENNYKVYFYIIENNISYALHEDIILIKNPINIKAPFIGKIINNFSAAIHLFFILRKEKINTIISHLFRANYINIFLSLFKKHKSIVVTHGSILKYSNKSLKSKINVFIIKNIFKHATKKVFLTQRMLNDYLPIVGEKNNFVIPNCYNLDNILELSRVIVDDNPFSSGEYFIFVGRFHPVKNISFLLDTFKKTNYKLLLIGDGALYEDYKEKYKSKNIKFLGNKENPYPYIKHAKYTVLTSISEGFPNVLIESLYLGVPVISSDCRTGPREILKIDNEIISGSITSNQFGILFNINDEKGFILSLQETNTKVIEPNYLTKETKQYNINHIVKKYIELI
ncbi:glycosyltransferase [Proteus sp. GOKU]|uniref:glycosyltransferase n=1 Tax=Proteus TaxID=583 RepID=UPI001892CF6D|nr:MULTISPECIES: glycosyltransferase [Proteus]QPB77924.1 glycosyltransferase [Proteus sp. GOKU]QQP23931.1 glycosyltransferase [Proteus vulgaris]